MCGVVQAGRMLPVKPVGEPCAGKRHARFDGGSEDVEDTDDLVRHPPETGETDRVNVLPSFIPRAYPTCAQLKLGCV